MSIKNSEDVVLIQCSPSSIRRFIKMVLAINETRYWFHQTLTFKDRITDERVAKESLIKLLDSLRKTFPQMPALFVHEWQKRQVLHYHVIFILFGDQPLSPEETRKKLKREIFSRWKKINAGKVVRKANLLTKPENGYRCLYYLLKGIKPTTEKLSRQPFWHGIRSGSIIKANSHYVSRKAVKETYESFFARPVAPQTSKWFTMRDLKKQKGYFEETGADWATYKKSKAGRKISDGAFLLFLNGIVTDSKPIIDDKGCPETL